MQDRVFFTGLLKEPAVISFQIGDHPADTFQVKSSGIFHSSAPFNGRTGAVRLQIVRDGALVALGIGEPILTKPINGITNYNAWVGGVDEIER